MSRLRSMKQEKARPKAAPLAIPTPEQHAARVIGGAVSFRVTLGKAEHDEQGAVQAAARAKQLERESPKGGKQAVVYAIDKSGAAEIVPRPCWQDLIERAFAALDSGQTPREAIDGLTFDLSLVTDVGRAAKQDRKP